MYALKIAFRLRLFIKYTTYTNLNTIINVHKNMFIIIYDYTKGYISVTLSIYGVI